MIETITQNSFFFFNMYFNLKYLNTNELFINYIKYFIKNFYFTFNFRKNQNQKRQNQAARKIQQFMRQSKNRLVLNNFCPLKLLLCYNSYVKCYISVNTCRFNRYDVKEMILTSYCTYNFQLI